MVKYSDLTVVIPSFNEEESISMLVRRIIAVSNEIEVLVVSDGSSDRTAEAAAEAGARVIEHTYNLGNGAAVKTGAIHAVRPYIVFMDADLQHQPEDIPRLLEYLPAYDMVVGARTAQCDTDRIRNLGNKGLIFIAEMISLKKIDDLTSGFRAVKRDIFLSFSHLYPQGYSYPTTSLLAFLCSGHFVKFVPLPTISRRTRGTSGIKPFRHGVKFLEIILRIVMLFNPSRIFTPIAAILFFLGLVSSTIQLIITNGIHSISLLLLLSGIFFFIQGLQAEQSSKMLLHMHDLKVDIINSDNALNRTKKDTS